MHQGHRADPGVLGPPHPQVHIPALGNSLPYCPSVAPCPRNSVVTAPLPSEGALLSCVEVSRKPRHREPHCTPVPPGYAAPLRGSASPPLTPPPLYLVSGPFLL